jgi:hypothetical protein
MKALSSSDFPEMRFLARFPSIFYPVFLIFSNLFETLEQVMTKVVYILKACEILYHSVFLSVLTCHLSDDKKN